MAEQTVVYQTPKIEGETGKNMKMLLEKLEEEPMFIGFGDGLARALLTLGKVPGYEESKKNNMQILSEIFQPTRPALYRLSQNQLIPARWYEILIDAPISQALGVYTIDPILDFIGSFKKAYDDSINKTGNYINDLTRQYDSIDNLAIEFQYARQKYENELKKLLSDENGNISEEKKEEFETGLRTGIIDVDINGDLTINGVPVRLTNRDGHFESVSNYNLYNNFVRDYEERARNAEKRTYELIGTISSLSDGYQNIFKNTTGVYKNALNNSYNLNNNLLGNTEHLQQEVGNLYNRLVDVGILGEQHLAENDRMWSRRMDMKNDLIQQLSEEVLVYSQNTDK